MLKLEGFKKFKISEKKHLSYIYGGGRVSKIHGSSDPKRRGRYDKQNQNGTYDLCSQQEDSHDVGWH